jgi:hypothetical protein
MCLDLASALPFPVCLFVLADLLERIIVSVMLHTI